MGSFSLGTVWEQTIAFLRRESGLLVPVALAIYGPAQVMLDLGLTAVMASHEAGGRVLPLQALLVLPGALLVLLGNMAVALIALRPGISVGEALTGALRRLGPALLAMLALFAMVAAVGIVIVIAATLGAVMFGGDPRSPAIAGQLRVLVFIPAIVVWVRMQLLPSVLAHEPLSPIAGIRRAWQLGRHHALRLIGVVLLTLFLGMVAALLETFVVGSLAELAKLALGEDSLPSLIQLLFNAAIEGLLGMAIAVYVALVYRAIAAG